MTAPNATPPTDSTWPPILLDGFAVKSPNSLLGGKSMGCLCLQAPTQRLPMPQPET
ncbi:HIRA; HIR histone cell cycle regulation defective protein A-like protein [Allochromatium vinosum DSM 180]|uniref:HIRA HIR histone cell cycle regulation defective protein A-like protein n=1 Tax=Allochromatium vinosum (strain ATCC 17899 / DSM 180 / NBRC 103801 / NCIMB 10441 / D) TaxID=572477 RepID=D3RPE8_ALLVD|nr:HIRA; HIR histone cell cycle regulation defective protein A-like protein [Allochromatium vinosum DSM 180]